MRVLLFHFHAAEADERGAVLRAAGHDVTVRATGDGGLAFVDRLAPDVVVVDLRRLPSHGRGVAAALRARKASRHLPLVFVAGDPEKTEHTRAQFPDATFAPWERIRSALRSAVRTPVANRAVAPAAAGYSGTPLPKKLGVRPGSTLALLGAPADVDDLLAPLPERVVVRRRAGAPADVLVVFAARARDLAARLPAALRDLADGGALWIAWPKKASGVTTDVTQDAVRALGLDAGLVDTKVCAIDDTWSGLQFRRRRAR